MLCEGRTDLAFWTGLLCKGFGCTPELNPPPLRATGADAKDGRKHHFRAPAGHLVEVFSVGGKDSLLRVLTGQVKRAIGRGEPIARLLVNYDPDDVEGPTLTGAGPGWRTDVSAAGTRTGR